MCMQTVARLIGLIAFIILARILSVADYGKLLFGLAMARMASSSVMMGASGIMIRAWGESTLKGINKYQQIFQISNWYLRRGLSIICLAALGWLMYEVTAQTTRDYISSLMFTYALPLFIFTLYQTYLISVRKVFLSNLMQLVLNIFWLLCALTAWLFHNKANMIALMICSSTSVIACAILIYNFRQFGIKSANAAGNKLSFALVQWGGILLTQIDMIILKFFSTAEDLAYYGTALQLSFIISFVLGAINTNAIAQLSEDYHNKNLDILQKRITYYSQVTASLSVAAMLVLVIAGYWVCQLYGVSYIKSYHVLTLLMLGQMVNVLSGSNGWILNIAGYEKTTAKVFYYSLLTNIILGVALIKPLGVYGLALASSISIAQWNIVLVYFAIKKIGINTTIFNLKKRRLQSA